MATREELINRFRKPESREYVRKLFGMTGSGAPSAHQADDTDDMSAQLRKDREILGLAEESTGTMNTAVDVMTQINRDRAALGLAPR
jgi:hypothetical protein